MVIGRNPFRSNYAHIEIQVNTSSGYDILPNQHQAKTFPNFGVIGYLPYCCWVALVLILNKHLHDTAIEMYMIWL